MSVQLFEVGGIFVGLAMLPPVYASPPPMITVLGRLFMQRGPLSFEYEAVPEARPA
jgi:hypothetical protein